MDQVPHIFILTLYLNGLYNSLETWFAREMPHPSSWKKILLSVCSVKLHLLPRLTVLLPAQDACSPSSCTKTACGQPDNESSAWLLNKAGIQSALRKNIFVAELHEKGSYASIKVPFDFVETYHCLVFLASTYGMLIKGTQELCASTTAISIQNPAL